MKATNSISFERLSQLIETITEPDVVLALKELLERRGLVSSDEVDPGEALLRACRRTP